MLLIVCALAFFYTGESYSPVAVEPGITNVEGFLEADKPVKPRLNADCDSVGKVCSK